MKRCSLKRMAEVLAQQPVLCGAVVLVRTVCGRVTTRLVSACAVTVKESVMSTKIPNTIELGAQERPGTCRRSKRIYGRNSPYSCTVVASRVRAHRFQL